MIEEAFLMRHSPGSRDENESKLHAEVTRKVVGFTKYSVKPECCLVCGSSDGCTCFCKKQTRRKPAQICKPLRILCKPTSKRRCKIKADFINEICKQSGTEAALCISSSISSICRRYDKDFPKPPGCKIQAVGCNMCCCCPKCCMNSSVLNLECKPSCCQASCNPCSLPAAPPCWRSCGGDTVCQATCPILTNCFSASAGFPSSKQRDTGKHCTWKPDIFEQLPFADPKPPCLPLPPMAPKTCYNCPCDCNCDELDSDVDVTCQNSIDEESALAEFFQKKMANLSIALKDQCEKVDEKTKELETCMKAQIDQETVLCDTEKKVLESCRAVKKVECELMNMRNRICHTSLSCTNEREERFCPKIAIQYVRVLQSKLHKVRSGSMLKQCLLEMCKASKVRLSEYNETLRSDIEKVQEISKKIKKDIGEIKNAICAATEAGGSGGNGSGAGSGGTGGGSSDGNVGGGTS